MPMTDLLFYRYVVTCIFIIWMFSIRLIEFYADHPYAACRNHRAVLNC